MKDGPPRVLSNLYRNGLQTLYEFLLDLIAMSLDLGEESNGSGGDRLMSAAELRTQAAERLIGDGDPPEYRTLLKSSYAVMAKTAPSLGHVSFEQRWTQAQIVDRVIVRQFQQEDKPPHVLCAGYRKLRPSAVDSSQRRSPPGLECICENSPVEIVNSPSWKILLSRVGDLIMLYVLTHAAIFSPLPNNCFLQLSGGPSTSSVLSSTAKFASVHPGEKMLGATARKKWGSVCSTRQHGKIGRHLHPSLGEREEEKQRGRGVLRNQTSNNTLLPCLKSHRTESTETALVMDVRDGYSKSYDVSKGKVSKRRRWDSGEKVCENGGVVSPHELDTFTGALSQFGDKSPHVMQATCPESDLRDLCRKRAPEGNNVEYSAANEGLHDDDGNPSPCNSRMKRRKLNRNFRKDRNSQEVDDLNGLPHQVSADVEAMVTHDNGAFQSQMEATPIPKRRVRLPSWKRRKLRQAQESCLLESVRQDASLESGGGDRQSGIAEKVKIDPELQKPAAKVEKMSTKTPGRNESRSCAASFHPLGASEKGVSGCRRFPFAEGTDGTNFGRKLPENTAQRRRWNNTGVTDGVLQRLVDRAPIFYNSNYSCHPGLPAKHILNTTKPDEIGVTRLSSAIFGVHCKILSCPIPGAGHMHTINRRANPKPGQRSQFKPVHKLFRELLSNARRCAYPRLLRRHCPLPEGFYSIYNDSHKSVHDLLPESQTINTEQMGMEFNKEMQEDKKEECSAPDSAPEVEEMMTLLLGQDYQPMGRATAIGQSEPRSSTTLSRSPKLERREFSSVAQQPTIKSVESETRKQVKALEASSDDGVETEKERLAELIPCFTAHSKVVDFLWAVCRSIIPREMLGCVRSWRVLRSSIAHFVGLRRHEKFNVKHAVFKLRLSSFPWLVFPCNNENSIIPKEMLSGRVTVEERDSQQQRRLELWLYWLFTSLVVPLIRAHFYVTENENQRQNVFYYRKPVWARIRSSGIQELTSKTYTKLSKRAVAQAVNSRVFGFSQIRLLPKKNGLRPIANLAASSQGTLRFSMLTQVKATLCQVFGDISKHLLSDDSGGNDGKVLSWPHRSLPPIKDGETSQCTALVPYETSSSSMDDANSEVDWCLSKSSLRTSSLSSLSPSRTGKRHSLVSLKSPIIWKRFKASEKFYFRSANSLLRNAYFCLKLEKDAHPEDLGSSVFGYCDVHRTMLPFIMQLKESPNGMPRLFMAVCDVAKAYDTIPQEKLQEVVESFVHSSNYKVARYTCVSPTLASVKVSQGRTCTVADEPKKFVDSVLDLAIKRPHCVFVDQAFKTSVRRDKVLAMLGEHVKANIVQIGSHFFQQNVGIPQGSVVSSLLCSLFYGHYDVHRLLPVVQSHHSTETSSSPDREKRNRVTVVGGDSCLSSSITKAAELSEYEDIEQILEQSLEMSGTGQDCREANRKSDDASVLQDNCVPASSCEAICTKLERDSVLLRLIDDSLFISISEVGAKLFVESMHRGCKEYGCQANERKTATSFCLQLGNRFFPRKVYESEDGACFMRWSGLLINCFTLEFQADYTRYCGEHIRSALTVRRERNPGWQLVLKMCQYMRPKCHALFYDPRINSPATTRLNAFQAFLLCAMKFHAYVCCLPRVTGINEPFLYKAIDCAIRYMYGLLRHKMRSVGAEADAYFPYKELEWLALIAFCRVLKRKQARYPILLKMMLRTKLQTPEYAKLKACPHLSSATDERRSSMFKYIKY